MKCIHAATSLDILEAFVLYRYFFFIPASFCVCNKLIFSGYDSCVSSVAYSVVSILASMTRVSSVAYSVESIESADSDLLPCHQLNIRLDGVVFHLWGKEYFPNTPTGQWCPLFSKVTML